MNWEHWSLDRVVILFVGLAYIFIGIQVSASHYRQNFHKKIMWAPVLYAPILSVLGIVVACSGALYQTYHWLLWGGVLAGLGGFYHHAKGVASRVGGFKLRNFLVGPPVILPLLFSAISVLGLLGYYWRETP